MIFVSHGVYVITSLAKTSSKSKMESSAVVAKLFIFIGGRGPGDILVIIYRLQGFAPLPSLQWNCMCAILDRESYSDRRWKFHIIS